MSDFELQKYRTLNRLAKSNGTVIFGTGLDFDIPIGELKQAFSIEDELYNRSIHDLSIKDAIQMFNHCVLDLYPETVLLHIGGADVDFFEQNPAEFDQYYNELINHIHTLQSSCNIAVISLKNYENNSVIESMNTHLKQIATFNRCEYIDIAKKKVWNPKNTQETVSFLYSFGFMHKQHKPIYDLVKILFCYNTVAE